MKNPLWIPSEERKRSANISRFIGRVNARHGLTLDSYAGLYQWSVEHIPDFWAEVWDFAEIRSSKPYDKVVADLAVKPVQDGAELTISGDLQKFEPQN